MRAYAHIHICWRVTEKREEKERQKCRAEDEERDNKRKTETRNDERRERHIVHALPLFAACVSPTHLSFPPVVFLVTSFRISLPLPSLSLFASDSWFFFSCALSSLPSRSAAAGPFFKSVQFLSQAFTCNYGIFIAEPESDSLSLPSRPFSLSSLRGAKTKRKRNKKKR